MSASGTEANFGEVDSIEFAIYLNQKARERNISVNVTKIQKWLYICYGLYLAVYEKQLLHERPKAWDYGPAFPRVHKTQKKNNDSLDGLVSRISKYDFSRYDSLISATLNKFGDWTSSELVTWTHAKDTAWDKTIRYAGNYSSMDNHDILLDFRRLFTDG